MRIQTYFIALLTILYFSSCSKTLTYFTDDLQRNYNWSESELKKIQFYVSEDIRLVRAYDTGKSQIKDGQIQVRDESKVDEVIIKEGTPGLLVYSPNDDRFAVSFEENSDKFLMFGPNKKANGKYVLMANEWKKRGGIIKYGGVNYRTSSDSAYAALMVDISKANKVVKQSQTAGGRRIGG